MLQASCRDLHEANEESRIGGKAIPQSGSHHVRDYQRELTHDKNTNGITGRITPTVRLRLTVDNGSIKVAVIIQFEIVFHRHLYSATITGMHTHAVFMPT